MKKIRSMEEYQYYLRGILCFFDELCRNNDIQYTILDGTLLGAVRNGGFIPWDGDVDVALTWDNYRKLEKAFDNYNGRFYLNHVPNHFYKRKGFKRAFGTICAKVIDRKSDNQLFGIDVFTIDFLGDDLKYAEETVKIYREFGKKEKYAIAFHLPRFSSGKSVKRNLRVVFLFVTYPILKLVSLFYTPIFNKEYRHFVEERLLPFDENSKYFTIQPYCGRIGVEANTILSKGYQDIQFDNMNVMSVGNYDAYLIPTYHNYMKLPPTEKRVPFPSERELMEVSIEEDDEILKYLNKANHGLKEFE